MRFEIEKVEDGGYIVWIPATDFKRSTPVCASHDLAGVLNYLTEKFEPRIGVATTVSTYAGGLTTMKMALSGDTNEVSAA